MPKLALMCKDGKNLKLINSSGWKVCKEGVTPIGGSFSTGNWVISREKAESLIGGDIILVGSMQGPSYIGGKVTKYRRDDKTGRTTFFFKEDKKLRGIVVHRWTSKNPVCYLKSGDLDLTENEQELLDQVIPTMENK